MVLSDAMEIRLKRVYEPPADADGFRVLVDRLWPRGISKERAKVDLWAKEVAPSPELRKAWHSAPIDDWRDYLPRYLAELDGPARGAFDAFVAALAAHPVVTFVYAAGSDPARNHAMVLAMAVRHVEANPGSSLSVEA